MSPNLKHILKQTNLKHFSITCHVNSQPYVPLSTRHHEKSHSHVPHAIFMAICTLLSLTRRQWGKQQMQCWTGGIRAVAFAITQSSAEHSFVCEPAFKTEHGLRGHCEWKEVAEVQFNSGSPFHDRQSVAISLNAANSGLVHSAVVKRRYGIGRRGATSDLSNVLDYFIRFSFYSVKYTQLIVCFNLEQAHGWMTLWSASKQLLYGRYQTNSLMIPLNGLLRQAEWMNQFT